ncbi:TraR/DksA family transcriptional regulator [Streptomyces sp. RerS4]|uniref:TraR/DksA family transcriptional regulator n=1 Tax=Streptomyces sp. RerS4 TaxID=2942449 RepID=UPI00201C8A7A|nr:TraR/DksA family transcriptional regulator [Streptomyces sp. RerS4]UQX00745.1 TraR/DksA family transcriptional regulator [Streptomyces sp. RerS4]
MVAKKTATQEVAAVPGSTPAAKRAAPAKKAATKKVPAEKAGAKAAVKTAVKTTAETAAKKKTAATRTAVKAVEAVDGAEVEVPATKKARAAEKAPAKKVAKKAPAKKAAPAATAADESTTSKATSKATAKAAAAEGAAPAARKTGARKVVAKKTAGTARKTAAAATSGLPKARDVETAPAGDLAVRPGEDPWTEQEVEEARTELLSEVVRLRTELDASEVAISDLMRDSGDGAGDDQADTGTKNITRESELALAANATSMLEQTERALERLEAGTYGLCENCGKPIGKARMQAFPRATLCVDCKQKQERRH